MNQPGSVRAATSPSRPGLRRAAGFAAIFVLVLAVLLWLGSRHTAAVVAGGPAAVSGVVVFEGGPLTPDNAPHRKFRPVRYAQLVVIGHTAAGLRIVRYLTADSHGRFAVNLAPGRYTVTALTYGPASRSLSTEPHRAVTVRKGRPLHLRFTGHLL
jgi:peptidoglycan/LPS O-acetylase OafA/YrhL